VPSCLLIDATSVKPDVCGDEDRDGDANEGVDSDSDEEADSDDVITSCAGSLVMI
jgi:hypothetical protein